jgi:hypothetical protein
LDVRRTGVNAPGVAAEQDLGDGQTGQFGVGEARWSARASASAEEVEEVVDLDVECHDEGVEVRCHTSLFGTLTSFVTAGFLLTANSEALI